jgi:transglutaminase-like putative cysteine protease
MARPQGTSARTQRLNSGVATALLAVATSLALARVFVGGGATWRMLVAGLASGLIACALERRNLLLATAVSAVAMIVAVGLWVFPHTTFYGLPTMHTLHAIGAASRQVSELARVRVAPTPPAQPLLLAAMTSVWAAIFSAHALAFRAGSPLLALLPPVALVAFADTVVDRSVRPLYGVAFLIAAIALVFADGLRRVQGWGPVWLGPGREARLSRTAGRSARRVAAVSVLLALMAPVLVPGFGSKAVIDLGHSTGDHIEFDPLVSVASTLTQRRVLPVMHVQTDQPSYLRMLALSTFDGTTWRPDLTAGTVALSDIVLSAATTPGVARHDSTITVDGYLDGLPGLPVPYPPVNVTGSIDEHVRYTPLSGALTLDENLERGTQYVVEWAESPATASALRGVAFQYHPPTEADVALPANTPQGIHQLALRWTSGQASTYDKVIAIQDHFRGPDFTYSVDVDHRDDGGTLLDFLTTSRRGFCQQFASGMAVMLRTLGIPARVAIGFTAGAKTQDSTDTWTIKTSDAHAWVEVNFPGYGWLTFDPTPTIANPATVAYTQLGAKADCSGSSHPCRNGNGTDTVTPEPTGPGASRLPGKISNDQRTAQKSGGVATDAGTPLPVAPPDPWHRARPFVLLGFLAVLLGMASLPPIRALRRRVRLRRAAGNPTRLILTAYDVFTERAAELGLPRGRGETLEEYRLRVVASGARVNGHLDRLSSIASNAAYGPDEPDGQTARTASEAAHRAWKDMKRGTPLVTRLTGPFRRS